MRWDGLFHCALQAQCEQLCVLIWWKKMKQSQADWWLQNCSLSVSIRWLQSGSCNQLIQVDSKHYCTLINGLWESMTMPWRGQKKGVRSLWWMAAMSVSGCWWPFSTTGLMLALWLSHNLIFPQVPVGRTEVKPKSLHCFPPTFLLRLECAQPEAICNVLRVHLLLF